METDFGPDLAYDLAGPDKVQPADCRQYCRVFAWLGGGLSGKMPASTSVALDWKERQMSTHDHVFLNGLRGLRGFSCRRDTQS